MKLAEEIAYNLLDIFCIFGVLRILQSDNGKEFDNKHVVQELKYLWPELAIVHEKPRHSQSQGSIERANQDVKKILFSWMSENNTKN